MTGWRQITKHFLKADHGGTVKLQHGSGGFSLVKCYCHLLKCERILCTFKELVQWVKHYTGMQKVADSNPSSDSEPHARCVHEKDTQTLAPCKSHCLSRDTVESCKAVLDYCPRIHRNREQKELLLSRLTKYNEHIIKYLCIYHSEPCKAPQAHKSRTCLCFLLIQKMTICWIEISFIPSLSSLFLIQKIFASMFTLLN